MGGFIKMSLTLNLGNVTVSDGKFADGSEVVIGGKPYTVGSGEDSLSLGDNGILTVSDTAITFEAGKGFTGTLTEGSSATGAALTAVGFSKAGGAVTFDAKEGHVVTITGSDYNDKLTSKVDNASIDGGDGDDAITFSGEGEATIVGGKGDDKISVTEMASVSISDAEGDDTYVISGKGAEVTIDDAKGSDNVKISGASVTASVSLGGADDNVVLIDSGASDASVELVTGDGDDVITSKAAKATLDISSAKGDDVITIAGKESNVEIDAGDGDDVIDIAKGADKSTVAISVGAGDDTVKINAASVTGSVDGGANDDVLVIAGANAELTVSAVETVNLTGKNGKVSVTDGIVNSSAVGATINAATVNVSDGTAVLNHDTAIKELTISKGSVTANTVVTATVTGGTFTSGKDVTANDTIVINGSGAVVDAGAGIDTITVSEDATGTNTLNLGAGNDVVSIEAGNSKVVITDLGDKDVLTLVDASDETTATLSKAGILNIVDAGQFNVTANVYTGDVAIGTDYAADIKGQAKNNVYHASVNAGDAGSIDLYTAAGTTKNVTVNAGTADKTIIDLTAAKSSEVTVAGYDKTTTTIALGNGKDLVSVGSNVGKTEISGYNFANKDAITVDSADVVLNKDGKLTVDVIDEDDETGVFVTTTANNNVYAAKVNGEDYYTAKTGAVKIATDKNVTMNVIDVAAAASSNINIAAGGAEILALSEGADVINVAENVTVDATSATYDYADGDVINLGKATIASGAKLIATVDSNDDAIGALTVNNVSVGVSALNDSLYAAKVVSNNNKKTSTYATAVEDASVAIDLSASSFGDVVFDGSDAADVNVAIGAGDSVTLSDGDDVITVNGLTKNTKEIVDISDFSLENDKLVLSNVKLADMGVVSLVDNELGITFGSKKSAVAVGAEFDDDATDVSININGTDVKAAITVGATLTLDADSKDAFFIGKNDTTLEVSDDIENTAINLGDTNKFNNIHAVEVAADATGISIIGTNDKKAKNAVDASDNTNGVQVSLGAGADSVTLSAGADVVWFDAKQGKDTVTSFTYGTGENADVLYLSDVAYANRDKIKFTTFANGVSVKDGSAIANVNFVTTAPDEGASEIMQVKLSDGKIYNVAMDVNGDDSIELKLDDEIKVDGYVVGKDVSVALKSDNEIAYTYNSANEDSVESIDGTNTNGAMTIVGAKYVTLGTSEEENANKVWAKGNATITATANAGNDQVWFQSGVDKKVVVTGFADYSEDNDANDNIKLVGTKSVADIVANYKFAVKDSDLVITGASSAASKLTLENTNTVVLTDDNGVSYVAKVGEKGDSADFSADVQIYAGMAELSSSNIEDDTVILLDGGSSTTFALNSDYYIGSSVTKFDAAGSTGNLVIVGGKTTKNELIGGEGDDLIYGGGASNDTMKGGEGSNTFFYGANDGKDVIENITDEDTINLYSGSLVDLGYNEDKNAYIFTFEGGNTLTVNGDLAEGTKVQYAGATFVYQKDDHTFIQA
jgi:hypothetical protein